MYPGVPQTPWRLLVNLSSGPRKRRVRGCLRGNLALGLSSFLVFYMCLGSKAERLGCFRLRRTSIDLSYFGLPSGILPLTTPSPYKYSPLLTKPLNLVGEGTLYSGVEGGHVSSKGCVTSRSLQLTGFLARAKPSILQTHPEEVTRPALRADGNGLRFAAQKRRGGSCILRVPDSWEPGPTCEQRAL